MYDAAAKELLRIPDVDIVTPRPPTQDATAVEDLADLFPADAWQLGQCKRLSTESGTLLFRELRKISESQWKLEPLTIVFGRGLSEDDANNAPIVLTALEGAEIQFTQSLDVTIGAAPPIKIGRMIGDVQIQRAGNVQPGESLSVQTRNVWIDKQKVWTTERIAMRIGNAILNGRDLTIHLAESAATAASARSGRTTAAILDRMDLVYLEELRIPLDGNGPDGNGLRRLGENATPSNNGVVSVRCKNGIKYDFALDRLSLADSVMMQRSVNGRVVDQFDCETLSMVLRDPANQLLPRRGPLDWIDRVYATGQPAKLSLTTYDFQLQADTIDFDALGGLLQADGGGGIHISRGMIRARLKSLAYQYDPAVPDVLGVIDVNGSGNVNFDSPDVALKNLLWSEAFKLRPIGKVTIDAVRANRPESKFSLRIDGNIHALLADGGTATAGSIQGLLKPLPPSVASTSSTVPARVNTVAEPESDERKPSLIPEVFHFTDGVTIQSSQVAANTHQLSLYFEPAVELVAPPKASVATATGPELNSNRGQPAPGTGNLASWVNQPDAEQAVRSPVARHRPQLSGDLISAKLLITPDEIQAKDISIKGNVRVKHHVRVGTSMLPVEMVGETMRAVRGTVSQSSGQDYLQIGSGPESPAELKMGDGYFIGPMIKVWPTDNVVQVSGAGRLRVPSDLLKRDAEPKANTADPTMMDAAADIQWKSPPTCRWGQSMQFDGQMAVLEGGVTIDAEMINAGEPWRTTMVGQQMQIALNQPVNLMDRGTLAAAEIDQISLMQSDVQPVIVRAEQRDGQQSLRAVHLINSQQLDFAPRGGGQLLGSGPGWYRGWMLTDNDQSMLPRPRGTEDATGGEILQGVHLTFQDEMRGDMANKTLRFTGGVRTGMRKLRSWDDAVDVEQMGRLAVGEMTMDCGRLQFGVSPTAPSHFDGLPNAPTPWEMIAEEGVVMRSNTEKRGLIEGTAARASYESKKGWLLVDGAPGRDAVISHTHPDGSKGHKFEMPRMSLNLETYEFHSILQDAQLNNLPVGRPNAAQGR